VILYPVCARVSTSLAGRDAVNEARRLGRRALELSAHHAKRPGPGEETAFPYDAGRVPQPSHAGGRTWHFSTTNTRGLAAAIVAPCPVGIDAEWLDRPRIAAPLAYFSPEERALLGLDERRGVLALWSAKESVLKLTRVGIAGMGRVHLLSASPTGRLRLAFEDATFGVAILFRGDHVVSIASEAESFEVCILGLEAEVAQ